MAVFRSLHIEPDTIAMVPVSGYTTNVNYSPDSIRWLDFVAMQDGVNIEHALNNTGERKVGSTYVDGFCEETNTIYQFHVSKMYKILPFILQLLCFFLLSQNNFILMKKKH